MSVIPSDHVHHHFRAMGSPCQIILRECDSAAGTAIAARLEAEVRRLEAAYSRFLPDTITTRINNAAGGNEAIAVDEETAGLLNYADTCYQQSDGLFDITSGSLRTLWNYRDLTERQCLPDDASIRQALSRVGWDKVIWQAEKIRLPIAGMEIDFGGIVKEYAADCVATIAEAEGVGSGMVELGGDIRLFGNNENATPWSLGIRDPYNAEQAKALVTASNGALATSGDYERFSIIQGKKYSHILNPLTGWPVEGMSSVSVLAPQCIIAGSVSSIGMLKGGAGKQWLQDSGLPYLCIDARGRVTGTIHSLENQK